MTFAPSRSDEASPSLPDDAPRAVLISAHTSPLAPAGVGDGGGMNVYVRALADALCRAGVAVDILTRKSSPAEEPVVTLPSGVRVHHLAVGPMGQLSREEFGEIIPAFVDAAEDIVRGADLVHAHYWVSAGIAHELKHRLGVPLVVTFHTLAGDKLEVGINDDPSIRSEVEGIAARCADRIVVSTAEEGARITAMYGNDPGVIDQIVPGVDHHVFAPVTELQRNALRDALGVTAQQVMVFAGRIQPLKGLDLAIETLAAASCEAHLYVIGGASGPDGLTHEQSAKERAKELGVSERVTFTGPLPQLELADYYRAADVLIVPSRSETFGLVALEAAACGTPCVAAAVGGLKTAVVDGTTGLLVDSRDPKRFAEATCSLLSNPTRARAMGAAAQHHSEAFSWDLAAARLRRVYGEVASRVLQLCR